MPLVHFDRQTVLDFFNIPVEDAEQAIKEIDYKDPIDVHDDFSGDDVKAIAMTYAHRKYPSAANTDKVAFGSQVSYMVCGMYTGVAHYKKEQKAEAVFNQFTKAFGVEPGDEGPEIKGAIDAKDFTRAGILLFETLILLPDTEGTIQRAGRAIEMHASSFNSDHYAAIQRVVAGLNEPKL